MSPMSHPHTPPESQKDHLVIDNADEDDNDDDCVSPLKQQSPVLHHQRTNNTGSSSAGSAASSSFITSIEALSLSSRTLSDLSESFAYGGRPPRSSKGHNNNNSTIPRNIYPTSGSLTTSLAADRPWKQAYVLSEKPPELDCLLATLPKSRWTKHRERKANTKNLPTSRFPLILLLMDPWSKSYELMQLWIDVSIDTVRDVLQSLKQQLQTSSSSTTWNLDYDGLIERRGGRASVLINCVQISMFGVVPYEIWIAKPWKMTKESCVKLSDGILEHLQELGVVTKNNTVPSGGAAPMTLSKTAQGRILHASMLLTHHHARQFLTFCPPFEEIVEEDELSVKSDSGMSRSSRISATSLGLVKSYKTTYTEESQEVIVAVKKKKNKKSLEQPVLHDDDENNNNKDDGDTATTFANSTSPLMRRNGKERSDGQAEVPFGRPRFAFGSSSSPATTQDDMQLRWQPPPSSPSPSSPPPTKTKAPRGKRVGRLLSAIGFKQKRKNGFLNLEFHDSVGDTFAGTDDESMLHLPIEVDDDGASVNTSSAPLMIYSSASDKSLSALSAKSSRASPTSAWNQEK